MAASDIKVAEAVITYCNRIRAASRNIIKLFTGKRLSHIHMPASVTGVAHHNCHAGVFVLFISQTTPADNMGILKIIPLFAVGIGLSEPDHLFKIRHTRPVLGRIPVIIRIKNAGNTGLPEKYQGIGQRLEPVLNKGLQALTVLGIVVVYKRSAEDHNLLRLLMH